MAHRQARNQFLSLANLNGSHIYDQNAIRERVVSLGSVGGFYRSEYTAC